MRIKTSLIATLGLLLTLVSGALAQVPPPGFIPFSTFAALPVKPGNGTTRYVTNTDGAGCNAGGSTITMCYFDGASWVVAGTGTFTVTGANTTLHYVTTTSESTLSAEFNLGGLANGAMLKCVVATGVCTPTAAVEGTDFYKPGGTDVAVADGGTGSSTASGARTNLGLAIGTDVQAKSVILTDLAAVTSATDKLFMYDGANWVVVSVPSCSNATTSKLLYNTSTHGFSCGTDQDTGGGGSGLSDGDKGDITVSSSAAVFTIDNDVVTYAKMQNISATQRALGRNTAGSGDTEEVTASQLLDWVGATRGSILYRGASGWAILTPGTSGKFLQSNGTNADPSYETAGGTISGLTTGALPKAASSSSLSDSSFFDCGGGVLSVGACGSAATGSVELGQMDLTAQVAPSTPSSGVGSVYVDSTSKNIAVKNDFGTVNHGIQSVSGAIADDGSITSSGTAGFARTASPTFTGTVTAAAISASGAVAVTGSLNVPHSNTLPGTCALGDAYMDADATSGQRFYLCESTNTWALQGDGGGGGGGVSSVATTSPIGGGTITTTGTITCATCVVASSPGAGIAHFAGSTQTVTSSAVSLTADVTGTLAAGNGGTGVTSLGTGVATFLGTPSSANLAAALTNETGSGPAVFGIAPTLTNPALTVQALTDQTTVTWDLNSGNIATLSLGSASRTMAAPTNPPAGGTIALKITQGGSGSYGITWNSVFKWPGATAPTLSTAVGKIDLVTCATFDTGTTFLCNATLDIH